MKNVNENPIMNFYLKTLSDLEQMNVITSNEKALALEYLVDLEIQKNINIPLVA